jgi:TctA family transporter
LDLGSAFKREDLMELVANLAFGFSQALTLENMWSCFVGVLLGTLIGVLPGLGPAATIAMLLPASFTLEPTAALIMLAGIYYGAQYGGSTTAILLSVPGEASSVVTALDGYQMAKKGRAGVALATAAIGSFVAGTFATLVIAGFSFPITELALAFGPPEYFSLMVLGLTSAIVLASGSAFKAVGMVLLGLALGLLGTDPTTGIHRFTFGVPQLAAGLSFVAVAMGVFGINEIVRNLEHSEARVATTKGIGGLWPRREDWRRMAPPIIRGTFIGSTLGILPGGGALLSSFASYVIEKRISRSPEQFGQGAIEGVAGPEAANNAGAQTSFIPMLTLGIPSNPVMALMMGAMTIKGIVPGPTVISTRPDLFWGIIASMWLGNLMLLILNLPLVGLWARLVRVPFDFLFPAIIIFCCIGAYSLSNSSFEVWILLTFGAAGYLFSKLGCEPTPLLLGFILGPMLEEYLRRTLILSDGDPSAFFTNPISVSMLAMAAALLLSMLLPAVRRTRTEALVE